MTLFGPLGKFPKLQSIWSHAGYERRVEVGATRGRLLTVAKREPAEQYRAMPIKWVVEPTLAWLGKCRPLSQDYAERTASSEAWVNVASIHLLLKRLQPD